jgi:hypothetical protein
LVIKSLDPDPESGLTKKPGPNSDCLQVFYLNLVVRGEVRTLFETFCKAEPGKKLLTVREFLHFINNHQRDPRQDWSPNEYGTVRKCSVFWQCCGSASIFVGPNLNPTSILMLIRTRIRKGIKTMPIHMRILPKV